MIALSRDYTSIRLKELPDVEFRLNVLRGTRDQTLADLRTYASSFSEGMLDFLTIKTKFWEGFTFKFIHPKSRKVSFHGYFIQNQSMAIISVEDIDGAKDFSRKMLELLIEKVRIIIPSIAL